MSDTPRKKIQTADILVILLCLAGTAFSINLFRLDLFQTLGSKNQQPVGTIIIKNNIVQRRLIDRVLWDRLIVSSPVYSGDLIRTAELSSAMIHIEDINIDLDENTIIRIQRSVDGEGPVQIHLGEGSLGLATGSTGGGGVTLSIMGNQVEAAPGTTLNASTGNDGMVLSVSGGTATFIGEEGERREVSSGTVIALNTSGADRTGQTVVAIHPRPNARYLKPDSEPLNIGFAWNRINFDPGEGAAALRLEIAGDRNFNRIVRTIENPATTAGIALDAGQWYWRLRLADANTPLYESRFTVVDAAGPELLSPATDTLFHFDSSLPKVCFQWTEIEEASAYILEIAPTPDFLNPRLSMQTTAPFVIDSSLGAGTWYWRIKPVFPSVYEGSAAFSSVSSFYIEQEISAAPPVTEDAGTITITEAEETIVTEETEPELVPEPLPGEPITQTPPVAPQPAAPPPVQATRYIALSDAPWLMDVTGENAMVINNSSTRTSVAREAIDGQEREVVTVEINLARVAGWAAGYTQYESAVMVRRLQQGSGIRFKALGDGQTWYFQILTSDIAAIDYGFYEAPIQTRRGQVVEIDVPYSRLRQPDWASSAPLNRNSITGLQFNKHSDHGKGLSTIKIFDIEVYDEPAAQTPPPQRPAAFEMVRIQSGTFTMGSPNSEPGRAGDNTDASERQHRVSVSAFYMGKYPVTQREYQEVMGTNPSRFKGDDNPVDSVNWFDALVYCNKLSMKEGLSPAYSINDSTNPGTWGNVPTSHNVTWNAVRVVSGSNGYRLPTEAEWEYACRAGTTTAYNAGATISDSTGWYRDNSSRTTHPVGQKASNAWGLYDMHGNVWEWCWDRIIQGEQGRIARGGSYIDAAEHLRSAYRNSSTPFNRTGSFGFRVVRP